MQERRTLIYLDQDDIPASAMSYDGTDSESIAGNVVYLPCQNFGGYSSGTWKIVSAGEYASHIIDVTHTAYYDVIGQASTCYYSNRANDYATSSNYTWKVGCGTLTTSNYKILYNGLMHDTSGYVGFSILPSVLYGSGSSVAINPIILNKWVKVKFDNLVKVYRKGSPTQLTLPFYVDSE